MTVVDYKYALEYSEMVTEKDLQYLNLQLW